MRDEGNQELVGEFNRFGGLRIVLLTGVKPVGVLIVYFDLVQLRGRLVELR